MFAFVYISKYFYFMKGKRYFGGRFSFLDGKCIRTVTLLQTRPRFGTTDAICTSDISAVYPRVFRVSLFADWLKQINIFFIKCEYFLVLVSWSRFIWKISIVWCFYLLVKYFYEYCLYIVQFRTRNKKYLEMVL